MPLRDRAFKLEDAVGSNGALKMLKKMSRILETSFSIVKADEKDNIDMSNNTGVECFMECRRMLFESSKRIFVPVRSVVCG